MKHPLPRASKSRSLFPVSSSSPPAEQPGWGTLRAWGGAGRCRWRSFAAPPTNPSPSAHGLGVEKPPKTKQNKKKRYTNEPGLRGDAADVQPFCLNPSISAAPQTEAPRPLHAAHLPALRCLAPAAFSGSAWAPLDRDRLVRSPSDNTTGHFWSS